MPLAPSITVDINQWPDAQSTRQRKEQPQPPGGFSFGTSWLGGPAFTDPFQAKRAPSPWQLVENYNSLIYAMVARNRNAVTRLPLRLYADGSRAQGGKPRSACDPIRVSRHIGMRLAKSGQVSSSAVDQVFEIRTHPLLDTIDRPDPYGYFTREKLLGLMTSYCDVVGSFWLMPEGNGWRQPNSRVKGPPEYLWTLYSQYVVPMRKPSSPLVESYQYFAEKIPFDQLLWFRTNLSLRDAYGSAFSPTYAGETYRAQEQKQIAILDQVLGLGPRPNLIASAKDPNFPPGDMERKRFEQDLLRRHSAGNAGGVLVNTGAWDFTPVSYSPADLAGKEISEYDIYALAAIFGQPATYYTVDSNLANLQAADEQHARMGVEPRCKAIEGTLTHLVQTWDPRLFFKFDPALPEDEVARQQVIDMQLKSGQVTINEVNEELKYDKKSWGDAPWIPGTLQQPDMIMEAHTQGMEQMKMGMDSTATKDELAVEGQGHQMKMDKAGHDLEKKKVAQAAKQKQERAIMELAETVLLNVQAEVKAIQERRVG